jgi:nitrile hydratase accessory protein
LNLPSNILDQNLPPFDEPWQAQAYAMTQVLIESGSMKAEDWAYAFGAAIRARLKAGAEDTTDTYFAAIGDALASVLALHGVELDQTISGWRNAYETTPHGKPVVLAIKT